MPLDLKVDRSRNKYEDRCETEALMEAKSTMLRLVSSLHKKSFNLWSHRWNPLFLSLKCYCFNSHKDSLTLYTKMFRLLGKLATKISLNTVWNFRGWTASVKKALCELDGFRRGAWAFWKLWSQWTKGSVLLGIKSDFLTRLNIRCKV